MTSSSSTKFSEMDFETSYDESKDTDFSPKQESIDVAHELLKDGKVSLENEFIPAAIEELSDAFEGVDIEEDSTEGEQVEGTTAMTKDELLEIEDAVTDAFEENYEEHDRVARAHVFEDSEGSEASDSEDSDGSGTETEESEDEEMLTEAELARLAWLSWLCSRSMKRLATCRWFGRCLSSPRTPGQRSRNLAMDSGNYSQAQEDFTACIACNDLKKALLADLKKALLADVRSLAEAWYQKGVAQAYSGKFAEAEASLKSAVAVLEARKTSQPEEVEELEEVVKEIGEEVAEHKTMEKEGFHYGPGGKLTQSSVAVGGLSLAAGPITGGSA